jgi:hypothetical protein
MPFKSIKQRKFMWAKHPDIARKWIDKYGSKIKKMVKKSMRGK